MADLTPAEELRAAATRLREHAQAASASPGLAAPLAAWMESWDIEIREDGPMPEDLQHALNVARAILGGTAMTPAKELAAAAAELRKPPCPDLIAAREQLAALLDHMAGDMSDHSARVVDDLGDGVTAVAADGAPIQHGWTAALSAARAITGGGRG